MITIAICDDDLSVAQSAEKLIQQLHNLFSCEVFLSGEDLLRHLKTEDLRYNIYLMDIEMPGSSGIETAAAIRKEDQNALILFLTDHKEYVYEVFEVLPFRFLRKPVSPEKLEHVLLDAARHIQMTNQLYFFQIGHEKYQLPCHEILYFESRGRKIIIHTKNQSYEFYGKMKEIAVTVDPNLFCKIHGSFLVNMEAIRTIRKQELILQTGEPIPISKRHLVDVKSQHLAFLERRCTHL